MTENEDFLEWLKEGDERGWSKFICGTHDSALTEEEWQALEDGDDPCIPVLRLYVPKGDGNKP